MTTALNFALVELADTTTEVGTATADALLLNKLTLNPPLGAGALRVTVHESFNVPVAEAFAHVKPLSCAWLWPNSAMGKPQNKSSNNSVMLRNIGEFATVFLVCGLFVWSRLLPMIALHAAGICPVSA